MDLPLIYDINRLMQSGRAEPIFEKSLPSRFGIIPSQGDKDEVRWFEAQPYYIYHTINCWEEGNEIIMDCCINLNPTPQEELPEGASAAEKLNAYLKLDAHLHRYHFNLKTGATREYQLDDVPSEFPLMNSQYLGKKSKYAYNQRLEFSKSLRFDGIIKYDTEAGTSTVHEYGEHKYGTESPFVPRMNAQSKDDGYVISFVPDAREETSEVIIVDAQNVDKEPLARIKLPQRVPLGFHACWVAGDRLFN